MRTVQTPAGLPQAHKAVILWKRVIIAAVLSEIAVTGLIIAIVGAHAILGSSGTGADSDEFSHNVGYYTAAPAAVLAVFLMAFWAIRRLDSDFIVNGLLVGIVATLLTVGFIFGARPEDRWMYIASFASRIAAGYAAGVFVQRMKERA